MYNHDSCIFSTVYYFKILFADWSNYPVWSKDTKNNGKISSQQTNTGAGTITLL